jgi:hypothetical protein
MVVDGDRWWYMQLIKDEEISKQLDPAKVKGWTEMLRGFAPKSNKQMQLYIRDFPQKYQTFKEILQFFKIFGDKVSEERLVNIIRDNQRRHGYRVNFNLAKLAGVKQYMKFYERTSTE